MFLSTLLLWAILFFIMFYYSTNLLLLLLILEIMGFYVIYYFTLVHSISFMSDFLVILLFALFVMEGVIALSGLISLVSFSGSDYVRSSSLSKL